MNLSDEQCTEKIAEHFAAISREYSPLNTSLLPERVKVRLADKTAKKPKAVIPGDLPNTIVKEFMVELANPVSKLCKNIAMTASWPKQFKVEYVTPIGKIPLPQL